MEYVLFFLGLGVMFLAIGVSGFLKLICWAGSVALMAYSLPKTEILNFIPADEHLAASLFLIGIIQAGATYWSIKFFDVTFAQGVTDIVVHILGLGLIVTGIVMACC